MSYHDDPHPLLPCQNSTKAAIIINYAHCQNDPQAPYSNLALAAKFVNTDIPCSSPRYFSLPYLLHLPYLASAAGETLFRFHIIILPQVPKRLNFYLPSLRTSPYRRRCLQTLLSSSSFFTSNGISNQNFCPGSRKRTYSSSSKKNHVFIQTEASTTKDSNVFNFSLGTISSIKFRTQPASWLCRLHDQTRRYYQDSNYPSSCLYRFPQDDE